MNWGEATLGTDLDGCSVISRHADDLPTPALVNNAVIVIHIPSEEDLQPWLLIGYAGDMAPYSGISSSGLSIFSTVLDDQTWNYNTEAGYEPFKFTFRKAIESVDYNQDGVNNMLDVRDAISSNLLGYSWGWNFAALAPSTALHDSLIALVAEVAPEAPYITFRNNSYDDLIPGDNLFAANSQIKRHNYQHYCWRYYGIVNHIGDGSGIGSQENWDLMKNYTNLGNTNLQFMQYIPEWGQLNLSVYQNNSGAYLHDPVSYDVNEFFQLDVPNANFTVDTNYIIEGDTVHFTDLSENNPTSWEWQFEGGTPFTSTEQNPEIKYVAPGDYDVKLIVVNSYGSDTIIKTEYIHVDSLATGIETYNPGDINLYPNPVKNKLFISSNNNIQSVNIINISGQVVKKQECNAKQIEINIIDLPDGIYIICLQTGCEITMYKIIKL
jgi:PKD repeat protein